MTVDIDGLYINELCFTCFHYHKGFCYAKQIYVEPNSLCVFYMTNWKKVRG